MRLVPGHESLRVFLLVILTFVTGIMDAVGYLALDRVFTGNMTGNIVILGMALAGGHGLPVAGPLLALFAFMAGSWAAGLLLRGRPAAWSPRHTLILSAGATIATAVAILLAAAGGHPTVTVSTIAAPLIALQMGAQAMAARHLSVKDMTTVVVTSTLVSLAGESLVSGGLSSAWNRRAAAILAIMAGAAAGALLLGLHVSVPILLAVVLTAVVILVGHRAWEG